MCVFKSGDRIVDGAGTDHDQEAIILLSDNPGTFQSTSDDGLYCFFWLSTRSTRYWIKWPPEGKHTAGSSACRRAGGIKGSWPNTWWESVFVVISHFLVHQLPRVFSAIATAGIWYWAVLYDRVGLGADAEDDIDRAFVGEGMGWAIGELITVLDGGPLNWCYVTCMGFCGQFCVAWKFTVNRNGKKKQLDRRGGHGL